jgi:transposase-like protein
MTRVCIRCSQIIGEKCAHCGTQVTAVSNGHAMTVANFDCASCGHHFQQGDGGETGGMCETCFDAELRNAHEYAAKNPPKMDRHLKGSCRTPKGSLMSEENLTR